MNTLHFSARIIVPPACGVTQLRLGVLPLRTRHQKVLDTSFTYNAPPLSIHADRDLWGTDLRYLEFPDSEQEVTVRAAVEVNRKSLTAGFPKLAWDQAAALVRAVRTTARPGDGTSVKPDEALRITACALPSPGLPLDDDARDIAFSTFSPGAPLLLAVAELAAAVAERTAKAGPDPEGVGASHLMIGALRAVGLSAGFVRGVRLGGVAHSWVAVWVPGLGWFPIDPSSAQPTGNDALALSSGRDLSDVPWLIRAEHPAGGASEQARCAGQQTPPAGQQFSPASCSCELSHAAHVSFTLASGPSLR